MLRGKHESYLESAPADCNGVLCSFVSSSTGRLWEQFKTTLSGLAAEAHRSSEIKYSVEGGIRKLNKQFRILPLYNINAYLTLPEKLNGLNWRFQTLLEDATLRAGILNVYPSLKVPLHDHPGGAGALLVLSGSVKISQYSINTCFENGNYSLLELKRESDGLFQKDDVSIYSPMYGNIHSLLACETHCALLSVQLKAGDLRERSWFFPVLQLEERLLVNRVKAHLATEMVV